MARFLYVSLSEPGSSSESPPLTDTSRDVREEDGRRESRDHAKAAAASASKYLPLLPKPLPSPQPPTSFFLRRHGDRRQALLLRSQHGCRVKICRIQNCTLRSHKQYVPNKSSRSKFRNQNNKDEQVVQQDDEDDDLALTPATHHHHQISKQRNVSKLSIMRGGVDGLPALPLDGLEENPVFRELFHVYYSYQYDRLFRVLLPPAFTKEDKQAAETLKRNSMAMALSTPIYCYQTLAAAHHQEVLRTGRARSSQYADLLYGKLMALLRAKLDKFESKEIGTIMRVILTLLQFDMAAGRIKSLHLHRHAVHHLLKRSGGIHNMDRLVPFVLSMDRILSIYTLLPPIYDPPPNQFIRKPRIMPISYGTFLDEPASHVILGDEVHQYCVDACQVIEILEAEGWSFDPHDPPIPNSPNLHYFFFLRDCLVNNFVRLHVKLAKTQNIEWCILLTAKIVDYSMAMDCYLLDLTLEIADKVKNTICDSDNDIRWDDYPSIFRWVLFVLSSLTDQWRYHSWALSLLKEQLQTKYSGDIWPVEWRQHELDNVRQFVWANTKFGPNFVRVCNTIQRMG